MTEVPLYEVGDHVRKHGGDYQFSGIVVAAFYKLSGLRYRYVVEDPRGLLFIFAGQNLDLVAKAAAPVPPQFPRKPRIADHIEEVELPGEPTV